MDRLDHTYDRPREKVRRKGVAVLSDVELLQLMIGSGTGSHTVGKIARRTSQLLKRFGSSINYDQLEVVVGLGPARISQLLAMFELASRYPVSERRPVLKTAEAKHRELVKQRLADTELGYMTLDGAGRLLRHRKVAYSVDTLDTAIRSLCAYAVADCAAYVHIGRYSPERLLIPTLADLSAAKNAGFVGRLLGFTTGYIVFNDQDWHSVTKDVSHVER